MQRTEPEPQFDIGPQETRQERLLRTGKAHPRFFQGVFPFMGRGMFDLAPLDDSLAYTVPPGHTASLIYFRAGNHSDDLIYLTLTANDRPLRYFPIGPKSDLHLPLSLVEHHPADTVLTLQFAAPRGLSGTLILDVGMLVTMDSDAVG